MNALIASLPTGDERNQLRQELKVSGFEKCMGGSLRTCKEKFYGAVHDGLRTWVSAATEDGGILGTSETDRPGRKSNTRPLKEV
jgi:hypothetical protein